MRQLVFFIFCITVNSLSAQSGEFLPGYIVSTAQDTTYGYIKDVNRTNIGEEIQFKTDLAQADPTTYTPEELSAFFFEPSFYFSAQDIELNGQSEKRFLRKLVEGYASLYQYVDAEQSDKYDYLIVKASGEQMQLSKNDRIEGGEYKEDKAYVGQLKYVLRECQEFVTGLGDVPFSAKVLARTVVRYNECAFPEDGSNMLAQSRRLIFKFGATAGLQRYQIIGSNLQPPNREFEESGVGVLFGVMGNISYFRRLSLQVGVLYANYQTDYEFGFTLDNFSVQHEFSNLIVPVTLKYQLSTRKFAPYVYAGGGSGAFLNGTVHVQRETGGVSAEDDIFDLEFTSVNNLVGGVGISTLLGRRTELNLNLEYLRVNMLSSGTNEDYAINTFALRLEALF